MKSWLLPIVIFLTGSLSTLTAQACLPDGIVFTRQSAIDSFPLHYPGCEYILGSVTIQGPNITQLHNLAQVKGIGGSLSIIETTSLPSMHGLHNLTDLYGSVAIDDNEQLADLEALANITEVQGGLSINANPKLRTLHGLELLTGIYGHMRIASNSQLTTIEQLSSLTVVASGILILNNVRLRYLTGLEGLTYQNNSLKILNNDSLLNFEGLQNIRYVRDRLDISNSPLVNDFYGFRNLEEVKELGIYYMKTPTLAGFDKLHTIEGNFAVGFTTDLHSLDGLLALDSIGGHFTLHECDGIDDLEGLEKLKSIRSLSFYKNASLRSLHGLENLTNIKSSLAFTYNPVLEDLSALLGTSGLDFRIEVQANPNLVSLYGMDSLCSSAIYDLIIEDSPNLSMCDNPCICAHLLNDGTHSIALNMAGCNSREEIIAQCIASATNNANAHAGLSLTPNPADDQVILSGLPSDVFQFAVYDLTGRMLVNATSYQKTVDISMLAVGVYLLIIETEEGKSVHRLVKG